MQTKMVLLGACTALLALPAFARTPAANPMRGLARFAGTVQLVDGKDFRIVGPGGTTATYRLADSVSITTSKVGTIGDLQSGKFVGCTAVKMHDGKLHATECHIFPESMRGMGEGHSPMGPPNTTMTNGNIASMTNGNVQSAAGSAAGVILRVSYKGGEQQIEASPRTHVTLIAKGDASLLKPGAKVAGAFRKASDGTDLVQFLNVTPARGKHP